MRRTEFNRVEVLKHLPSKTEMRDDTIYVSLVYGCVNFICPCGCGGESHISIKNIGETTWTDGWTVTLENDNTVFTSSPSILDRGCGAHFFIEKNKIRWC